MPRDRVDLLVTLDRHYMDPLITMVRSYAQVHPGVETRLYVAHSSLTREDLARLEQAVAGTGVQVCSVPVTDRYFRDIPVLERLPEESFYRLLAFCYLPPEVERCLYLDPDVLVRRSLLPLYRMPLGDNYLAAAGHLHGLRNAFNLDRLGCEGQERYLNSGVMVMDLQAIRRDFTLEGVLASLEENVQRLLLGDQDLVNILFGSRTLLLDERIYNLDERAYRYYCRREGYSLADTERDCAIIHYNGRYKPWNAGYVGVLDRFYPPVAQPGPAPMGVVRGQIRSALRILKPGRRQALWLAAGLVCLVTCLLLGRQLAGAVARPEAFRSRMESLGAFDELVFLLVRAAQTVVKFIPSEPVEIAAGFAWGAVLGTLLCIAGNLLGSCVILGLTRRFGRRVLELFLPVKNLRALSLFENSRHLYGLIFLVYLIPGLPKDGFTYLVGLMRVRPVPFLLLTALARIPSVLASALCGEALALGQYRRSAALFAVTLVLAAVFGYAYWRYVRREGRQPQPQTP